MSPGKQLVLPDFPVPRDYMEGIRLLSVGACYTIIFYDQNKLDGPLETAVIENMELVGYKAHGSELQLLLSESANLLKEADQ